jgi:S1-C subfamily serine protease
MRLATIYSVLIASAAAVSPPAHAQIRPPDVTIEGPRLAGPRIGISVRDLRSTEAEQWKIEAGAVVETVRPGSPAATAGLASGDVIVEFDGDRVRSARQLTRLVTETPTGRDVNATILRNGQRSRITLTPADPAGPMFDADRVFQGIDELFERLPRDLAGAGPRLGVTVQELTPQLAEYFGATDGVLVAAVAEGSAAARAGIRAGDVITEIDAEAVRSRADVVRRLSRASGEVTLGIVRDKRSTTLKATIEPEGRRRDARPVRPIGYI